MKSEGLSAYPPQGFIRSELYPLIIDIRVRGLSLSNTINN